ncbi:MAG: bacterial proteasome activator family protein [Sporichthyaceae bacterium]
MTQPPDERSETSVDQPGGDDPQRVLVVRPDGMAVEGPPGADGELEERSVTTLIDQPAKVMRIGSMIKQLLEEVRSSELDEASRARLRDIHTRSIKELEEGLAPELIEELERISLPFSDKEVPSEAELRVAQAQLVGWLEGLFHGIQTALFAQQMAARAQFEEIRRRALPAGMPGMPDASPGEQEPGDQPGGTGTGQYL